MAPPRLSLAELRRLAGICARFASDFEAERATAAKLASNVLRGHGLSGGQVLHAEPLESVVITTHRCWTDAAQDLLDAHLGAISDREAEFLASTLHRGRAPTPGQPAWLLAIAERCGVPTWQT